jgi:hypothetical protein
METNLSRESNRESFRDYRFIPSVLVDVSRRSTATTVFGHECAAPFGIAPMGLSALSAYRGDIVLGGSGGRGERADDHERIVAHSPRRRSSSITGGVVPGVSPR